MIEAPRSNDSVYSPSYHAVKSAMDEVGRSLSQSPSALTAIIAPVLDLAQKGIKHRKYIRFTDESGASYTYSASLRPHDGIEPIDALYIRRGRNRLFMQIARSGTGQVSGEAELIVGHRKYREYEAIERAHHVFERFFRT
jgi:hypothetical protein